MHLQAADMTNYSHSLEYGVCSTQYKFNHAVLSLDASEPTTIFCSQPPYFLLKYHPSQPEGLARPFAGATVIIQYKRVIIQKEDADLSYHDCFQMYYCFTCTARPQLQYFHYCLNRPWSSSFNLSFEVLPRYPSSSDLLYRLLWHR